MNVRFWGTRGSLPASLDAKRVRRKVKKALEIALEKGLDSESDLEVFIERELPFWVKGTYGTNTSCIEIRDGDDFIICDAGTGLRDFGNHFVKTAGQAAKSEFHIFISHPHWDHIQGFPFFTPAYAAGNRITIYGCHQNLASAFHDQQSAPFFPVYFDSLGAEIRFVELSFDKTYDINGFKVLAKQQNHPGKSYGFRFEKKGKAVVYSTDSEYTSEDEKEAGPFLDFFSNADLLIFDAQYNLAYAATAKEGWGHSNNVTAVELALKSNVKHLCLYHNEPVSSDEDLDKFLLDVQRLAALLAEDSRLKVSIARDGMEVDI